MAKQLAKIAGTRQDSNLQEAQAAAVAENVLRCLGATPSLSE